MGPEQTESVSKADLESSKEDLRERVNTSVEADLLERYKAKEPSAEEKQELRAEHRRHLVRETTSTLTVDANPDMEGVHVDSKIEIPDLYCFTCDEWVGVSGVDLSGTPRSKTDAYYLGGPPEALREARQQTREKLHDFAYQAFRDVDRFESVENAYEFVADQLAQVRADHDE